MVDLSAERFNEAFLESAPQALIQISMAARLSSLGGLDSVAQILSIISSMASLSLAATDYTSYKFEANPLKRNLTVWGTTMVFSWRFPTIACRCLSLGLFTR